MSKNTTPNNPSAGVPGTLGLGRSPAPEPITAPVTGGGTVTAQPFEPLSPVEGPGTGGVRVSVPVVAPYAPLPGGDPRSGQQIVDDLLATMPNRAR